MPKGTMEKTVVLVRAAHDILAAEHPMTLRQLFYRLVSVHALENSRQAYQMLSRVTTQARESGDVDPAWITDRSKPEYIPNVWGNPQAYLETVARSYRRDYWHDQPVYTEVWIEKDSLTGSIESVVNELGVTLRAHRGYGSTTKKMEIANLFDTKKVPIVVFYIGDHDPSGVDIERDLLAKVLRYQQTDNVPSIRRLGILKNDITAFNLPPLKMKDRDPRAAGFRLKHGADVVEADALPPAELRSRIRKAVEGLIDVGLWNRKVAVEEAEFESILEFAQSYKVRQV